VQLTSLAVPSIGRRAALYIAGVVLAFLLLDGWREWSARDAAVHRTEQEMSNLARSLRQHAEDTYEMAEGALANLVEHFEVNGLGPESVARAREIMRANLGPHTRLHSLFAFGPSGEWLTNSLDSLEPGANNSDRAYFQHHATSTDPATFYGPPLRGKISGDWVLTLSRRINAPDGSFAGVVSATLEARYFADFYKDFDVGKHGSLVLGNTDGILLSRWPFDDAAIGTDQTKSVLFTKYLPAAPAGSYHFVSGIDHVPRIGGYDQSQRYPLVVLAAVSTDEALANWWNGAIERGIGTLLLAGVIVGLGVRLADQMARRRRSEDELAHREAEFRVLAESASDLVERFDASGIRRYVSPAIERLLGYRPEELIGTAAFAGMHEDDQPIAVAAAERLKSGVSDQETITYRVRHRDGRQLWFETSLRIARETADPGVIAGTRDITERKELELRLAAMATQDGLTGLANRRAFDQAIERELARAQRSGRPLSLLMIDVDRFKLFNDEYGHLAGDACLKAIASIVALNAKRPADVAARFGGEELSIILPDTNASAAIFLGGELCRQIHSLAIPHERNLPWQVATVSIGTSTVECRRGEPERPSSWLVSTADMALNQAKSAGRNRALAAPQQTPHFESEAG
jgi:diguanylate cyclase (GGDEF)-like protein/PAS domain S-box-containing protein